MLFGNGEESVDLVVDTLICSLKGVNAPCSPRRPKLAPVRLAQGTVCRSTMMTGGAGFSTDIWQ